MFLVEVCTLSVEEEEKEEEEEEEGLHKLLTAASSLFLCFFLPFILFCC